MIKDNQIFWYEVGLLKIDLKFAGKFEIADLQSGSFANRIPTVAIFTTNSMQFTIMVKVQTPISLLL